MIVHRAAGPGPRIAAPLRRFRVVAGLLLIGILGGCGAAPGLPSVGAAGPSAGSSAPAGGLPSGVLPTAPGGSAGPVASQPRWPGSTVLAVIALGAADGEIQKAGVDLQAAADKQDLRAMWGAADGLAKMIDGLTPNIGRLDAYGVTKPAAALYARAFPELAAGAKQLRDAITSGDTNGVVAGSQLIARGLADYAPVRRVIGALVEQAIVQQRLLLE